MEKTAFTLFFVLVVFFNLLFAQNLIVPFTNPRFGNANSFGFGNIFTTESKGVDGLCGNPAGLARSHTAQALLTTNFTFWGKDDLDDSYYQTKYDDYSSKLKFYPKIYDLSISIPIHISGISSNMVGGIGYRSFYDISSKNSEKYNIGDEKFEKQMELQGLLNVLSFGIGSSFNKKYYVGASINFPIFDGYQYENDKKNISQNTTEIDKEKETWDLDGGTFLQIGFIGEFSQKLTMGVTYVFSHSYTFKNGKWMRNNGGNMETGNFKFLKKYSLPGIFSLGATYKLSKKLTTGAEIQNCSWEDVKMNGQPILAVESGMVYRLGIKYLLKNYKLRLGFQIQRLPILDINLDPVNMKTLTFGTSIPIKNINIDLSSQYNFTSYNVKRNNTLWEYYKKQWELAISIKYFFNYNVSF